MADVAKLKSALITDCADNSIKAITEQTMRNILMSAMPSVNTYTTTQVLSLDDGIVICGGTTDWTVTLPTAATSTGKVIFIFKSSASSHVLTINPNVNGASLTLIQQYSSAICFCDGTNWFAI